MNPLATSAGCAVTVISLPSSARSIAGRVGTVTRAAAHPRSTASGTSPIRETAERTAAHAISGANGAVRVLCGSDDAGPFTTVLSGSLHTVISRTVADSRVWL